MRAALRIALSHYVTAGVSAALGLVAITTAVQFFAGAFAASMASVGVLVCIPPDQPAPQRDKFWQLLPAAFLGLPLFVGVQFLHAEPVALGLLVVPATFLAFLGGAWGKRGLRIVVSVMFAMIFSMALPPTVNGTSQWTLGLYFALGAGLYLVWATAANAVLNFRRSCRAPWPPKPVMPASRWGWPIGRRWTTSPNWPGDWRVERPTTACRHWFRPRNVPCRSRARCTHRSSRWNVCWRAAPSCWRN